MSAIELLLSKRMVIKRDNPTVYYQIKDELKYIKKMVQEKFGYIIIVTPLLIKLEKIPSSPEVWMGLLDFKTIREYQMFCFCLMFLEDKQTEEQFVLSHLTEFIQLQFEDGVIDWTHFSTRRQCIRVIQFMIEKGLIIQNDGNEEQFAKDVTTEVLYENTGISRYFMRNFPRDILEFKHPKDFEQSDWFDVDEDRGLVRRQRIYRRLLLSCGLYQSESEEDFLYIRNYRNQIQNDFHSFFPSQLHVHKSSCYVVVDESCSVGKLFPHNHTFADLILIVSYALQQRIKQGQLMINQYEQVEIPYDKLLKMIERIVNQNMNYLPKKYQDMGKSSVGAQVLEQMLQLGFIKQELDTYLIYPCVGKIGGGYIDKEDS